MTERHDDSAGVPRREFLKRAGVVAAGGALIPRVLEAAAHSGAESGASITPGASVAPGHPSSLVQTVLGNGEPPALSFQAWPGGNGALLERLWRESGEAPFTRTPTGLPEWTGPIPTDPVELAFLPTWAHGALIRGGQLSPVTLTELYLERLKRFDPHLLFATQILEERALDEARSAEREIRAGSWRGPLHGVPYGLKDLFSVRGTRTTWGAEAFRDQVIDEDAEVVVRLREAGAVLVAKLTSGEFALGDRWYGGMTRNPWNPEEGASGSSAGPGSAVAAGCVSFAIGTETQGSIISPARRNGVTALRPTFGRVSRHGGMVLSWSMDKAGPMCRSALDCALVFDAIHGADEKDPTTLTTPFRFDPAPDLGRLRIGYREDTPPEFLEALRELGARPEPIPGIPSGSSNAISVEGAAAFDFHVAPDGEVPPLPEGLSEAEVRRRTRFVTGRGVSGIDYLNSQRRRHLLQREMAAAMEGWDLYLSGSGDIALTNQTGHPSVVVPYAFGPRNPDADSPTVMPLTTMLVGALFADDTLLSVAHAFQSASDWHTRRPDFTS